MKAMTHDCRVKRMKLVWVVDALCAALLTGITILVACRYAALPDRIPVHYGADGVIDGYGSKSKIWTLVAIMWILVGVLTVAEQFPRLWNIPFKVTKGNQYRLLTLTWHLLCTTKLAVTGIFAYLTIMAMKGGNLSVYFTPIILLVVFGNSFYWIIRLFQNRKPLCV